jgi:acyl carrier protein
VYAFHPAQRRPAQEASGAGPELALDGLKQRLRATLPPPMIPGELHVVRSIPRTPNGKADRRALLEQSQRSLLPRAGAVAPRTTIEVRLAGIWADLLGVSSVGIHDSFFELGGHSLLATQLIFRIREAFGVDLSLHTLMQRDTVAALALSIMKLGLGSQREEILEALAQLTDAEAEELLNHVDA